MNVEDLILVSVDDHLIEPENMFDHHMPAKYKDRAPRVVKAENGSYFWQVEHRRAPGLGLNAVAGRPKEEFGYEPVAYDQVRAGCYDVHARIDDMNVNGVLGSINFSSFPGFGGARFFAMDDKDLALATIRAYNDWHIHDWCNVYPGRFIPLAMAPLWDAALAADEVRRMADLGAKSLTFPDNPSNLGLPSIHNDYWDPVWKACVDTGIVLSTHIGSGGAPPHASDDAPISAWITSMPMSIAGSAADWIFAPMWKKYPGLRVALSEGGIGWIPYLLERADFTQGQHGAWTRSDFGEQKPSDIFRKHFITCFIDDDFGIKNRDAIGIDMITWECDYPHSDSVWPKSPEALWNSLRELPREDIDKITHLNAMREFNYDPFAILGRENCTVGALRARAGHVDVGPDSRGGRKPVGELSKPVTSKDVKETLSYVATS